MLSKKQQDERDRKILYVVNSFLDNDCKISDIELSRKLNIPSSTIGRYLTCTRTRELIGIKNYTYIKKMRDINKKESTKAGVKKVHG